MRYLKILRAQLSEHEIIFLFYNWAGRFGEKWEHYFIEYGVIHNLNYHQLYKSTFINDKVNFLKTALAIKRTGKMFDIDK